MFTKIINNNSSLRQSKPPTKSMNVQRKFSTRTFSQKNNTNNIARAFGVASRQSTMTSSTPSMMNFGGKKLTQQPNRFFSDAQEDFVPRSYTRRPQRQFETNILLLRSQRELDDAAVKNFFGPNNFSEIRSLRDPNGRYLGATFVEFASNDDAGKAMSFFRRSQREGEDAMVACRPTEAAERDTAFQQSSNPARVVVVKRLPYSSSEEEVAKLFEGTSIQAVTVGNGSAVIKFASPQDAQKALTKNGTEFARRPIIVAEALEIDFNYQVARPIKVLRIRGAPVAANEQEFREFFAPAEITKVDFTYRDGISGRQVPGDVFVEFQSNEHLQQALKKDRQNMGERYLQLFRSSARERRTRLMNQFPKTNFGGNAAEADA